MLVLVIGSMIGFLIFNLRFFGKKEICLSWEIVVLISWGSGLHGQRYMLLKIFIIICNPITVIWFVAIPLLDCVALIFSRINKGISLASAGRDHFLHKLMKKFSPEGTFIIILIISVITGFFGIYLQNNFAIDFISIIYYI